MTTLTTSFALILGGLKACIGRIAPRIPARIPFFVFIWGRVSRTVLRFERLVTLWRAGTLPKSRPSKRRPKSATPRPTSALPQGKAWLLRLLADHTARAHASQLQHFLDTEPDLPAFLAAIPQAGRLLRPLAHMLGLTLPAAIAPKPRTPKPRPKKPRTPIPRSSPRSTHRSSLYPSAKPRPWPKRTTSPA
jgi:hypothetical protein